MKEFKAIGDLIQRLSVYFYVSVFAGIVLLITVVWLIYRRVSKHKEKKNEDKPKMSRPLFIANIIVYIILGVILAALLFFLLSPLGLFF